MNKIYELIIRLIITLSNFSWFLSLVILLIIAFHDAFIFEYYGECNSCVLMQHVWRLSE